MSVRVKNLYWSDNDFLLDDGVVVVDVLGQKVPRCGVELRQAVRYKIACVEPAHLTRYRLQIMVVVLCRLDPHPFEPEVIHSLLLVFIRHSQLSYARGAPQTHHGASDVAR